MLMMFVFMFFLLMSLLLSLAIYPLALGGLILMMSFIVLGLISLKFSVFFGLVLLLVFVGGLLVAFGYAIALAPNPVFGLKLKTPSNLNLSLLFLSLLVVGFSGVFFYNMGFEVSGCEGSMFGLFQDVSDLSIDDEWGVLVVLMGLLLFVNMVAVVSVCSYYKGALIEFSREK